VDDSNNHLGDSGTKIIPNAVLIKHGTLHNITNNCQ
jgi:hypothetical protein